MTLALDVSRFSCFQHLSARLLTTSTFRAPRAIATNEIRTSHRNYKKHVWDAGRMLLLLYSFVAPSESFCYIINRGNCYYSLLAERMLNVNSKSSVRNETAAASIPIVQNVAFLFLYTTSSVEGGYLISMYFSSDQKNEKTDSIFMLSTRHN